MHGNKNTISIYSIVVHHLDNIARDRSSFVYYRKIEERKKLLEPQVLRIADDDDLLENDLEVEESDEEDNYDKQSDYFSRGKNEMTFTY